MGYVCTMCTLLYRRFSENCSLHRCCLLVDLDWISNWNLIPDFTCTLFVLDVVDDLDKGTNMDL